MIRALLALLFAMAALAGVAAAADVSVQAFLGSDRLDRSR